MYLDEGSQFSHAKCFNLPLVSRDAQELSLRPPKIDFGGIYNTTVDVYVGQNVPYLAGPCLSVGVDIPQMYDPGETVVLQLVYSVKVPEHLDPPSRLHG